MSLELEDPIVTADPQVLRVILDGNPWVEARWFDSKGREWRDFAAVLAREHPGPRPDPPTGLPREDGPGYPLE